MGGKSRSKGCEPEIFAPGVVRERMLQCGKNTWAADVAVLAKNLPRGAELVRGNRALDGFYDIASTRVGDEPKFGS